MKHNKFLPSEQKLQGSSFGIAVQFMDDLDINESEMSAVIPFADGQRRDGVGDLLEIAGIDTSRHVRNPLVLFDHGKQVQLPIARSEDPNTGQYTVELDAVAKKARGKAFFYQGCRRVTTPEGIELDRGQLYDHALFCEQIFDMLAKRFIRAGSIGYQVKAARELPPDFSTGTPKGLHLLSILMLEYSVVVLPANSDTVGKLLGDNHLCGKQLSPYLVKSLMPYAPVRKAMMGYEQKAPRGRAMTYREAGARSTRRGVSRDSEMFSAVSSLTGEPRSPLVYESGYRVPGQAEAAAGGSDSKINVNTVAGNYVQARLAGNLQPNLTREQHQKLRDRIDRAARVARADYDPETEGAEEDDKNLPRQGQKATRGGPEDHHPPQHRLSSSRDRNIATENANIIHGWGVEDDREDKVEEGDYWTEQGVYEKDLVPGGLGDDKPASDFDADQLRAGIKVEMEHTDDPNVAREIAEDHLTEDPSYYRKLKKVEGKRLPRQGQKADDANRRLYETVNDRTGDTYQRGGRSYHARLPKDVADTIVSNNEDATPPVPMSYREVESVGPQSQEYYPGRWGVPKTEAQRQAYENQIEETRAQAEEEGRLPRRSQQKNLRALYRKKAYRGEAYIPPSRPGGVSQGTYANDPKTDIGRTNDQLRNRDPEFHDRTRVTNPATPDQEDKDFSDPENQAGINEGNQMDRVVFGDQVMSGQPADPVVDNQGEKDQPSSHVTPQKAREILHDGTVHGHPLTDKQRRMFGAAASRGKSLRQLYRKKSADQPTIRYGTRQAARVEVEPEKTPEQWQQEAVAAGTASQHPQAVAQRAGAPVRTTTRQAAKLDTKSLRQLYRVKAKRPRMTAEEAGGSFDAMLDFQPHISAHPPVGSAQHVNYDPNPNSVAGARELMIREGGNWEPHDAEKYQNLRMRLHTNDYDPEIHQTEHDDMSGTQDRPHPSVDIPDEVRKQRRSQKMYRTKARIERDAQGRLVPASSGPDREKITASNISGTGMSAQQGIPGNPGEHLRGTEATRRAIDSGQTRGNKDYYENKIRPSQDQQAEANQMRNAENAAQLKDKKAYGSSPQSGHRMPSLSGVEDATVGMKPDKTREINARRAVGRTGYQGDDPPQYPEAEMNIPWQYQRHPGTKSLRALYRKKSNGGLSPKEFSVWANRENAHQGMDEEARKLPVAATEADIENRLEWRNLINLASRRERSGDTEGARQAYQASAPEQTKSVTRVRVPLNEDLTKTNVPQARFRQSGPGRVKGIKASGEMSDEEYEKLPRRSGSAYPPGGKQSRGRSLTHREAGTIPTEEGVSEDAQIPRLGGLYGRHTTLRIPRDSQNRPNPNTVGGAFAESDQEYPLGSNQERVRTDNIATDDYDPEYWEEPEDEVDNKALSAPPAAVAPRSDREQRYEASILQRSDQIKKDYQEGRLTTEQYHQERAKVNQSIDRLNQARGRYFQREQGKAIDPKTGENIPEAHRLRRMQELDNQSNREYDDPNVSQEEFYSNTDNRDHQRAFLTDSTKRPAWVYVSNLTPGEGGTVAEYRRRYQPGYEGRGKVSDKGIKGSSMDPALDVRSILHSADIYDHEIDNQEGAVVATVEHDRAEDAERALNRHLGRGYTVQRHGPHLAVRRKAMEPQDQTNPNDTRNMLDRRDRRIARLEREYDRVTHGGEWAGNAYDSDLLHRIQAGEERSERLRSRSDRRYAKEEKRREEEQRRRAAEGEQQGETEGKRMGQDEEWVAWHGRPLPAQGSKARRDYREWEPHTLVENANPTREITAPIRNFQTMVSDAVEQGMDPEGPDLAELNQLGEVAIDHETEGWHVAADRAYDRAQRFIDKTGEARQPYRPESLHEGKKSAPDHYQPGMTPEQYRELVERTRSTKQPTGRFGEYIDRDTGDIREQEYGESRGPANDPNSHAGKDEYLNRQYQNELYTGTHRDQLEPDFDTEPSEEYLAANDRYNRRRRARQDVVDEENAPRFPEIQAEIDKRKGTKNLRALYRKQTKDISEVPHEEIKVRSYKRRKRI